MTNTVTISQAQYKSLSGRLDNLEQMIRLLANRLETAIELEPRYGSREWWKWGMKKGEEAIKKGEYTEISSKKQLDKLFNSL